MAGKLIWLWAEGPGPYHVDLLILLLKGLHYTID